jgi:hypothetical protein
LRIYSFKSQLEEASKWERIVADYLADIILNETIKLADQKEQRDGIDATVELRKLSFDLKFMDNRYYLKGIPIELVSVAEKGILGWFYTTKADAIVYLWWNENKTGLMPIGYYLILSHDFRKWFEENKSKYEEKQTRTQYERGDGKAEIYTTKFVIIPIEHFPSKFLKKFFTPRIEQRNQKKITEFC